jgi:hypothetical protein
MMQDLITDVFKMYQNAVIDSIPKHASFKIEIKKGFTHYCNIEITK